MSWALLFFKAVLVYEGRREVWETVQGWDTNKGRRKKQRAGNDDGDIILGAFEDSVLMWEVDLHTHTHASEVVEISAKLWLVQCHHFY